MTTLSVYSKTQIDEKMPKTLPSASLVAVTTGYEWTVSNFNGALCWFVIDTSNVLTDVEKVSICGYVMIADTKPHCIGSIIVNDNSQDKIIRITNVNYNNNKITFELDIDGTQIAPANYSMGLIYQDMYQ